MPWRFNAITLQLEFVKPLPLYIPSAQIEFDEGDLAIDAGDHQNGGQVDQGERVIDGNI